MEHYIPSSHKDISRCPETHKIKTDVLAQALKEFDGDYEKTAEHFGTSAKKIRERVYQDPQLYAIWVKNGTRDVKPDGIELMERQTEHDDEKGTRLLEALDKNSRYIFNNELESILTNQDNVQNSRYSRILTIPLDCSWQKHLESLKSKYSAEYEFV